MEKSERTRLLMFFRGLLGREQHAPVDRAGSASNGRDQWEDIFDYAEQVGVEEMERGNYEVYQYAQRLQNALQGNPSGGSIAQD